MAGGTAWIKAGGIRSSLIWLMFTAGLAVLFVWRASPLLHLGATLAVATGLAFALYRAQAEAAPDEAPGFLASNLRAAAGLPFFLLRTVRSGDRTGARRTWAGVGRGILVAAPAVAVFGVLLVSADAVFERLVRQTFGSMFDDLPSHIVLIIFFSGLSASFLFGLLHRPGPIRIWARETGSASGGSDRSDRFFELGVTEIAVALGVIDALFATFVIVQLPYLFGGASVVASTESLTVAEYARRGFFELTAVACLAVPMLLALYHLFRPDSDRDRLVFRFLAGAQLLLLIVMLASAGQRLWLYQDAFGLTLLRIYACAVMLWLLAGFAWFAATVLRDRPRAFLPGAAAAGIAVIVALHAINPAAMVVKTNAARVLEGKPFDVEYDTYRDADAIPALLDVLPRLPAAERSVVAATLLEHWSHDPGGDWRSWNTARTTARRRIQQAIPTLEQFVAEDDGGNSAEQAGPR